MQGNNFAKKQNEKKKWNTTKQVCNRQPSVHVFTCWKILTKIHWDPLQNVNKNRINHLRPNCVHQQWFYDMFLSPRSGLLCTIICLTKWTLPCHTCEWLSLLRKSLHTQSWCYHLLTATCLPVECSKQVFAEHSTIFQSSVAPVPTCLKPSLNSQ